MLLKVACLLIIILLGLVQFTISDKDCLYNKCLYRLLGEDQKRYTTHTPCGSTEGRILVRSIDCNDGLTYHICCTFPFRQDVQKSRQKWFRFVTMSGSLISSECTKRILCEQSCLDGLSGDARSDYPQILNDDTEQNKQYVEAYNKGENQACYGQSAQNSRNYTSSGCVTDCNAKYNECENELESSNRVKAFYLTSRYFHKLGMWTFSAWWLMKDTIREEIHQVEQSVKQGAEKLYDRMLRMREAFKKWAKTEDGKNRKRSIPETEEGPDYEKKWIAYMPVYNETDPNLVDAVNESLSHQQFIEAIYTINETLHTADFGSSGAFDYFPCGTYIRVFASVLAATLPFLIGLNY